MGVGYQQTARSQLSTSAPLPGAQFRTVLNSYCVGCHNEGVGTAGLLLDQADVEKISQEPELWEKVVKKLRTGAMPPAGMPRPDQATYDSFATYLERALDRAAAARPDPGRPVVHRLNRVEYASAVRDLLEVSIDGESLFPAEDSGKGFDNLGALLTVSPVLMERYMSAAMKISRRAVGDPAIPPTGETYQAAENLRGNSGTLITVQDERVSEDVPFGSRGGIAIRHNFAADGEYHINVQLQMDGNYYLKGLLGEPHQLDVFLDGTRVQSFMVGGERHGASGALHTRDGNIYIGDSAQQEYEYLSGGDLEGRFQARAGERLVGVVFRKKSYQPEGMMEVGPRLMAADTGNYKGGDPGIGTVTITGPYNATGVGDTPSRRQIFVCSPTAKNEEEACAEKILTTLARRAYRRPVGDEDIQPLLSLYRAGRSQEGFEEGIRTALQGILVSPGFLFRIEQDPPDIAPNTAYQVSDLELASRLSFFLWSSIPDDALWKWWSVAT